MDPSDRTELRLVFANKTVDDILLRSELDTLASKCADRFQLLYSVDNEPGSEDERKGIGHFGRIDGKTLEFLFPPEKTVNGQGRPRKETTIALLCGGFECKLDPKRAHTGPELAFFELRSSTDDREGSLPSL